MTPTPPEEIALKHIAGSAKPPREWNSAIPEELERITLKAMEPTCASAISRRGSCSKRSTPAKSTSISSVRSPSGARRTRRKKSRSSAWGMTSRKKNINGGRKRAKRVSYFTGIFSVGVFAVLLFVFLWNFWLEDLFRTAERVDVPDFTGKSYEAVVNDKQYSDYRFTVVYTVDPEVPDGVIIAQDPEDGKSRMRVPEGISVQLTVSTGVVMAEVPYVVNEDYEAATEMLKKAGFTVTTEFQASKDVTAKYVIRSEPAPGEKAAVGTSVKLIVSGGPTLRRSQCPTCQRSRSQPRSHASRAAASATAVRTKRRMTQSRARSSNRAHRPTQSSRSTARSTSGSPTGRKNRNRQRSTLLMVQGVIIKALSGFYYVAAGDQIVECKARGRFRYDGCSPLVGDRVQLSFDAHGKGAAKRWSSGATRSSARLWRILTSLS